MLIIKILGIGMIVLGIALLAYDFLTYAKQRLTEGYGLIWGFLSVLFVIAGIILTTGIGGVTAALVIAFIIFLLFLAFFFGLSRSASVLIMKNRELAMQVSLLNQENESILQAITTMQERPAAQEMTAMQEKENE